MEAQVRAVEEGRGLRGLRFNPEGEVKYRFQLALEYLEDAERSMRSGDYRGCVQYSQLSAENAAKAVIATRRVPSWGHDPSEELRQAVSDMGSDFKGRAERLAAIAALLAPEHGRVTYGDPTRMLTPRMLYDVGAAERCLSLAKEAAGIMRELLGR